jgi:cytochrome P450
VLADPRFSVRQEIMHDPFSDGVPPPAPPGAFTNLDAPEHTRYRGLLTGQFTVRRMRQLTERIQEITTEHLDAMQEHGPPVDLVQAYAQPIPALVICELLGVPYSDRERFQKDVMMATGQASGQEVIDAFVALQGYLQELVLAKRAKPGDDMLSGLTDSDLTDEELTNIGVVLLGAGLDTTANMISLGTFALLSHRDQFDALRADPALADQAVEELLRYLSIVPFTLRTALEDLELDGHPVKEGDSVTLSLSAADRDPDQFPEPDVLDLRRATGGHVAFGHGIHQCLGQQLARVEMRVALPALVSRFPTLRLAVPPTDVPMRGGAGISGVHRLPVTWDQG